METVNSSSVRETPCADEPICGRSARYGLSALGIMESPLREVDDVRKKLGPPGGPPFSPTVLRCSDAQTVLGLAAVVQAMETAGLSCAQVASWGIIAAPRYMGKEGTGTAIHKYASSGGGAWKVSPMVVPHNCLHALSGTISLALEIKGLNFGAGGGPNALVDGLTTACTALDEGRLPGLWLVMTQCFPEPPYVAEATEDPPGDCYAVALGFAQVDDDWRGLRLRIVRPNGQNAKGIPGLEDVHRYLDLFQFLKRGREKGEFGRWSCTLDWRASFELADEE